MSLSGRVRTGVRNLHMAVLDEDTPTKLTYGEIHRIPGLIKVDVNPGSNIDTMYTDNKASVVYSTLGSVEVTIEKDCLPDDLLKILLGRNTVGGVNYVTDKVKSPYVSVMFEQTYSDGSSSYVKLFKGKFTEPDVSNETKNDSVNFQTGELTGHFVATNYEKDFSGKNRPLVFATVDKTSVLYDGEGDKWFDWVAYPTLPTSIDFDDTNNLVVDPVAETGSAVFTTEFTPEGFTCPEYVTVDWSVAHKSGDDGWLEGLTFSNDTCTGATLEYDVGEGSLPAGSGVYTVTIEVLYYGQSLSTPITAEVDITIEEGA